MTTQQRRGRVQLGSLLIPGVKRVSLRLTDAEPDRIREGVVGRNDRKNARITKLEDQSGGLGIESKCSARCHCRNAGFRNRCFATAE